MTDETADRSHESIGLPAPLPRAAAYRGQTTERLLTAIRAVVDFDTSTLLAGQLAPSSAKQYAATMVAYLRFADSREAALHAATLRRWLAVLAKETKQSPNTINRKAAAVKKFMLAAAEQGYIAPELGDAFQRVRGVKVGALKTRLRPHARTRVSPAQMRTICNAPDTRTLKGMRDAALLATLASSALRCEEAATLRRDQLRDRGTDWVVAVQGKNDLEPREAPLSTEARRLLDAWIAAREAHAATLKHGNDILASPYLFLAWHGRGDGRLSDGPMSSQAVWATVQQYAAQVGIAHLKPHDFRRFVGTQLTARTGDIRKAQRALGHKDIRTTANHYVLDDLAEGLTEGLY